MPINNDDIDAIMWNDITNMVKHCDNLTDARYVENKLGLEDEKACVGIFKPITLDAPI